MRVYADLFFLLNAAADGALLLAAARLTGVRVRTLRLAAGAALGGAYGAAPLLVTAPALFSLPAIAAAGMLMAAAAFAPCPPRVFLRLLACLYGAAALAAGLALAVGGRDGGGGVPWWGLGLALGGAVLAGAALFERWRPGSPLSATLQLEVEIAGRRVGCTALLDTGSALADPCGGAPAVVVHAPVLRGLVPAALLHALAAGPEALPGGLAGEPWASAGGVAPALAEASAAADPDPEPFSAAPPDWAAWARRIRLLPYRTVASPEGLLCGLRPDGLWLGAGAERRAVRAVLAVSPLPLDPDGAFAALVPASLAGQRANAVGGRWGS